ncbi:DUF3037 domain-containing protein [Mucilaginibacter arboris]|uniref:DUF3037 domain-containing protein n=1 Tax=Mucilaginibacter arboris TaxID=2682090 RepID=A0A7K1SWN6_9SPHI|nr:DUF3037 domain-containing protein [Mucilaginibacter arboris]MVN21736.1 DUF3037 domain-containing protein [Mucilaginibacter arboris]
MQDHLFEYAVIRVVPRVEREEFLNVGVILYCAKQKFLQCQVTLNEERIRAFAADLDLEELKEHLYSFEKICLGGKQGGPIGLLDAASRFRWLTAMRSTVVQSSRVHPGLCANPQEMLVRLHEQLVL